MRYELSESIEINVSPERISELIHDLTQWPIWSPWLCLEPTVTPDFSDNNNLMAWDGVVIGAGQMRKVGETTNSIDVALNFIRPFKSTASAGLFWESSVSGMVKVTWNMSSSLPWFLFFMRSMMVGMIRMDYRRGLVRLKAVAEQGSVPAMLNLNTDIVQQSGFEFIGIKRKQVAMTDIGAVMDRDLTEIQAALPLADDAAYVAFYDKTSFAKQTFDVSTGVAFCSNAPGLPSGAHWEKRSVPDHLSMVSTLQGNYDFLGDAWAMLMMSQRASKKKANKKVSAYERYIVGKFNAGEDQPFETEVIAPVI